MLLELGRGITGKKGADNQDASYLDTVIDSVCCDLDATVSDSYAGSGDYWLNLIASPNDGAGQSDYDFELVSYYNGGTDPEFNGTAGDQSAYFLLNKTGNTGSNGFQPRNLSNTILKDLQKNTSQFWVSIGLYIDHTTASGVFWGSTWAAGDYGLSVRNGTSNNVIYRNGTGSLQNTTINLLDTPLRTYRMYIVSIDMTASSNNIRIWDNSGTADVYSADWTTGALDNNTGFFIGAANNGNDLASSNPFSGPIPTNTQVWHWSCGNEFLDDTKAAAIIAHLEERHGRDYTP